MNAQTRPHAEHGAALVVTLIVCAVLAMVVVALMQNATLDRASSLGIANQFRAKLAAESGVALAAATLATNSTNDTFAVVLNTNRQLFIGNGITNSANFSYAPLFSAVTNTTNVASNVVTGGLPALAPQGLTTNFTNWVLPGGISITSPVISWVYMTSVQTNASGQANVVTNARFAYWVEDLSGKLDLSVVGTSDTNVAKRPTGTNPAEIALWSLFSPSSPRDPGNTAATNLVSMRSNLASVASARFASPTVTTNILADLAVNLRHDTNEPELIPFGFSYADQGKPKYNLNTNTNVPAAVTTIAAIISANLPQFSDRAGGYTNSSGGGATNANAYTAESYLQTLAANVIDYADTDSNPTTDGMALSTNRVRPVYRGVDSYPFVNEISKRWVITRNAITNQGATQGRAVVIETTDFVELWNPSSQATQGNFTFLSVHRQTGSAGFQAISFANPTWASNAVGAVFDGVSSNTIPVNVAPNGFAVYPLPTVTNFFFLPLTNSIQVVLDGEIDSSRYHAAWNATYYDAVLGGLYRAPGAGQWSALGLNSPTNRANLPSFIYRSAGGVGFGDPAVGDPRATIYLSRPSDATAWNRTSFGGRNDRGISGQPYGAVSPRTWPDSGHDSPAGISAPSQATLPVTITPAAYSNIPPSRISNLGFYSNITELGAVFDPIQWSVPALTNWQGRWTNLPAGASADNGYGGGNSLRIGRAEHPRFTADGQRAAQLLDLFAVGPTNTNGIVLRQTPGRINVNTASSNVLIALAAGVNHVSDPALQPNSTNYFPPATAFRAFAQGVTNFRSTRPFLSVNQLPSISTNGSAAEWPTNAVFGNSNSSVYGVSAWNDAAAEEWFSKIHQLATVRSRNFLIHAIGQSLATNSPNTVLSSFRMAMQVHVAPVRTNGVTTNSRIEFLQTWGL